jgi:RNHCP domain
LTRKERAAGPKAKHQSEAAAAGEFRCRYCHELVTALPSGTRHRNHCPHCLWSLHVDVERGDRGADCRGLMEPVGVWVKTDREWSLFHRCERCGHFSVNRIAGDDSQVVLLSLALRPIAYPPFPLTSVRLDFVPPLEADP